MKILITGGAGFIGANLCERLLKYGHEVFCLDNFYSSEEDNIAEFLEHTRFHLLKRDVLDDLSALDEEKLDQIYHLASPASPVQYQKDHIYTLNVNFGGTLNVLNFAERQLQRFGKAPKILFTSTSEAYGDPKEHPQSEGYWGNVNPIGIRSCYDEGKRVAESLCMNFYRQGGLPVKIVRVFNTYGPRMAKDDGRVVSNFLVQALEGKNLTVYGDGKQTRSFQYIDDLIDGLEAFMALDQDFPGPINLGNPHEFTINQLAQKVLELTRAEVEVEYRALPQDDPTIRCPDIKLAKEKLGWEPKIDLDQGLKKTLEYFKARFK